MAEKRGIKKPNNHNANSKQPENNLEKALQRLTEGVNSLVEGQRQLVAIIEQLVEWQQRTQGTISNLVEGQQRLQETVTQLSEENRRLAQGQERLNEVVAQLAEENRRLAQGQARLNETVAQLAEENRRLAQGQERLSEVVAQLAQGQQSLQETVGQLIEGQQRLQNAVAQLTEENHRMSLVLKEVNKKVGRLDEQFGTTVESVAQIVLPSYLEKHYGIKLKGKLGYELKPIFFKLDGEWEQVDLYGEGTKDGEEICVVCECKAKIHARDVIAFAKKLDRLWIHLRRRPIPVMFGYSIHPSAQELAISHKILLVSPLIR